MGWSSPFLSASRKFIEGEETSNNPKREGVGEAGTTTTTVPVPKLRRRVLGAPVVNGERA